MGLIHKKIIVKAGGNFECFNNICFEFICFGIGIKEKFLWGNVDMY